MGGSREPGKSIPGSHGFAPFLERAVPRSLSIGLVDPIQPDGRLTPPLHSQEAPHRGSSGVHLVGRGRGGGSGVRDTRGDMDRVPRGAPRGRTVDAFGSHFGRLGGHAVEDTKRDTERLPWVPQEGYPIGETFLSRSKTEGACPRSIMSAWRTSVSWARTVPPRPGTWSRSR
jgi:hypothetical protein